MRTGAQVAVVIALAICVMAGAVAAVVAGALWREYFEYESPHLAQTLGAPVGSAPVAKLTVMVVIDGLRVQDHARLHTVRAMESYGSGGVLAVPAPTLTSTSWRTVFSGSSPSVAGIAFGTEVGAAQLPDTLLDAAQRARQPVVFVGDAGIAQMMRAVELCAGAHAGEAGPDAAVSIYADHLLDLVDHHEPTLAVLQLGVLERSAREYGTDSTEYISALKDLDAQIGRVVEELQSPYTAFVVVSSGGQLSDGRRGGVESQIASAPCTLAGPGIRLARVDGGLEQIAASVAVLSGIPVPRHALAPPLDAFAPDKASEALTQAERTRRSFARAYLRAVGRRSVSEDASAAPGAADPLDPSGLAQTERSRLSDDRKSRFGHALAGLGALAIPLAMGLLSWEMLVASLIGLLVQIAGFNALYFGLHGHQWSLSATGGLWDRAWVGARVLEGGLAAIAGMVAALWVLSLIEARRAGDEVRAREQRILVGPAVALIALTAVAVQVAAYAWWWGMTPSWSLPDPAWWFKTFVDALQACGIAGAALLWVAVAWPGRRAGMDVRRRRAVRGDR